MASTNLPIPGNQPPKGPANKDDPYAQAEGASKDEVAAVKATIGSRFDKFMAKARFQRYQFEREWFQHVLYYSGNHWIVWDRDRRQWRKKKGPNWWPTPVTNIFAEKIDDNVAAMVQQFPVLSWLPETDDPVDIAAATVADRIDETIAEESGRKVMARQLASWTVLCGSAFVESYYDKSEEHGTSFIQFNECQNCGLVAGPKAFASESGRCPECGSDRVDPAHERIGAHCPACEIEDEAEAAFKPCPLCMIEVAAGLENGGGEMLEQPPIMEAVHNEEKVGEEVPRGKISQRIRSPFEIFIDHASIKHFSEDGGLRWVIVVEMMERDEAERMYNLPKDVVGASPGHENSLSTLYMESLAVLSNLTGTQFGYYNTSVRGAGSGQTGERVLRETLYELPTPEFPDGLQSVRISGETGHIVEWGPSAYHDTRGKPFIPVVHVPFKVQAGRIWGKSPASDLIPLQDSRNQTESMMIMSERRMANPVWLLPRGITDRAPTGEPGEIVWYKPWGGEAGRRTPTPERVPGVEPSQYFMKRLEELDKQMEKLAGSYGIAHGEAPPGITAASALALLGERQSRQVSPQINAWELAWQQVGKQQMMMFREYAADERIHATLGDNSRWQLEKWSRADLSGNVDVRVEFGSAIPKSSAQERAQIESLIRMMVIDPQNPDVNRKILELFGESELLEHIQVDTLDAQKENERFMRLAQGEAGGRPPSMRPLFDNHETHVAEHIRIGKTDQYQDMEERARGGDQKSALLTNIWESHIKEHMEVIQAAREAEMAEQAAQQEAPGPGAGRPDDTGAIFDRGARAPGEEAGQTVIEPRGETQAIKEPRPPAGA